MDLFAKCAPSPRMTQAQAAGYYPYFIPFDEHEGTVASYQGRRLIMAGSNNYLGLTTDERVKQAAQQAISQYGTSCTGSRFLNGTLTLHTTLEAELADYLGKEAAMVFPTGFQVNLGVISALVGRGDMVLIDKEAHASIVDGCRLAQGELRRFRHNDVEHLATLLRGCPAQTGKLVVVDGIYSMGGDIAPLPEIVALCQQYGARLLVDDAHATGVIGGGRGTAAHFGLTDEVDLIGGTFSKSFASLGGFIAGRANVITYLKHSARSFIFSASMAPATAAAALAALRIMRAEPERITRLGQIATRMRTGLQALGYDTGATVSPIVPVLVGDMIETGILWRALFDRGVYVNAIVPPAALPQGSLLRTSYMATHTDEQLDQIVAAFAQVPTTSSVLLPS